MKHLFTALAAALLAAVVILSCVSEEQDESLGSSQEGLRPPCTLTHTCGRNPHPPDARPPIDSHIADARPPIDSHIADARPPIDSPRIVDAPPPPDAPRIVDARPPPDAPRIVDAAPPPDAPRLVDAKPPVDAGLCSLIGQPCGLQTFCCTGLSCISPTTGALCQVGETGCACAQTIP